MYVCGICVCFSASTAYVCACVRVSAPLVVPVHVVAVVRELTYVCIVDSTHTSIPLLTLIPVQLHPPEQLKHGTQEVG